MLRIKDMQAMLHHLEAQKAKISHEVEKNDETALIQQIMEAKMKKQKSQLLVSKAKQEDPLSP